jgi:hypothetical protein
MVDMEKIFELEDRTCDALITGFLPSQSICNLYNQSFYIPSSNYVCILLGTSLREILGSKKGDYHWWDSVRWNTIASSDALNGKIVDLLRKVTISEKECNSHLDDYLYVINNPRLEHEWVSRLGDLFRYRVGERKKAIERAANFWESEELNSFKQIHEVMRKHTKEMFEKKRK